jgi:excisionase family DNA binding protein
VRQRPTVDGVTVEVMTTMQAARVLGVDVMEIYRLIDTGRLTPAWCGDRLVVSTASVDRLRDRLGRLTE